MRGAFGKAITEIAMNDPAVIVIVGDMGFGTFDVLRSERPDQFYNVGIMEQSMVSIAAGMALAGLKPWVYTITPFLFERAFEQIKLDVDSNNANVKLVGYADYLEQGITHIELLRFDTVNPFKNIQCYYPGDSVATKMIINMISKKDVPCMVSLKKDKSL